MSLFILTSSQLAALFTQLSFFTVLDMLWNVITVIRVCCYVDYVCVKYIGYTLPHISTRSKYIVNADLQTIFRS